MQAAQFLTHVAENLRLEGGYFRLELRSEAPNPIAAATPGQFVMLRGDWGRDLLNARAFSVLQVIDEHRFQVLAKVFGRGTARLHDLKVGDPVTCTGPLGSSFPEVNSEETQLLVAGGVGLPPLHLQARVAAKQGRPEQVEMFYGGRAERDLVLTDELKEWGTPTVFCTEDGSVGHKGRVTEPLKARIEEAHAKQEKIRILSCGPTPMLKAVRELALTYKVPASLCLEEEMACGIGVCLGCAVPVYGKKPYQYCCTDGPVFDAKDLRWS